MNFTLNVVEEQAAVSITTAPDNFVTVSDTTNQVVVSSLGEQGPPGPQNLHVQPVNPGMTTPGLWIQTGMGGGSGITFWVEDGA